MTTDVKPLAGYPEPYGLLCAILQDGTNEWRRELSPDLPAEAVVWQPNPGMHSVGGCLLHIAAVEVGWIERFALDLPWDPEEREILMVNDTDVDEWTWPTPPLRPLSWYFELHDRIRARTLESVKRWQAPDLPVGEGEFKTTLRWVLGHVIQHEAYQGGQSVLLSRLWQLKSQKSG